MNNRGEETFDCHRKGMDSWVETTNIALCSDYSFSNSTKGVYVVHSKHVISMIYGQAFRIITSRPSTRGPPYCHRARQLYGSGRWNRTRIQSFKGKNTITFSSKYFILVQHFQSIRTQIKKKTQLHF